MQKRIIRAAFLTVALVCALAATPAGVVLAHEGHDHGEEKVASRQEELKAHLEQQKERRQQAADKRLDAAKLRTCENRKEKITNIMERGIARAEAHLKLFDSIAERTKAFYQKKGHVLANYDQLVAAVDDAKAEAVANLEALKNIEPFDCSSNDPKGIADDYKMALKSLTDDLKAYRTAVKNLIVGVKSAQGSERSNQ